MLKDVSQHVEADMEEHTPANALNRLPTCRSRLHRPSLAEATEKLHDKGGQRRPGAV